MKEEDRNQTKINILLKEYSESQNSAQFHDNLLWVVTSIILAGVLAMIGLMANNFLTLDNLVISSIAIFGIILSICLGIFTHEFRKIKKIMRMTRPATIHKDSFHFFSLREEQIG